MQDQNQNLSQVVNPTPQAVSFGEMNTALSQVGAVPGRPVVGVASGVGLSGAANGGGAPVAPGVAAANPVPNVQQKSPDVKLVGEKSTDEKTAPKKPSPEVKAAENAEFIRKIAEKIRTSENILVALSRDPSVDEIAAAIGLTLFLDTIQKHTTAIYSGQTPDALQFLQPEGTFETNTDSLRDFIIALNKEKADSLRYKVEGDFVKVFITPYKSMVTEEDLEFSYGDFNVNLVLALGVPTAPDLDAALSEYGRIMHDATTVDITCDDPGKFGEIEWSDPEASSVSEMVTKLILEMQGQDATVDKEIATALLTGIVAATGRFSNDRTNSETMQLASKLMAMGADQQLISAHVMENDSSVYTRGMNEESGNPNKFVWEAGDIEISDPEPTEFPELPEVVDDLEQNEGETPGVVEEAQVEVESPIEEVPKERVPEVTPVPELLTPQTKAEMAAAAKSAVNEAISAATANAAAVGASGVGVGKPVVETPKVVAPEVKVEPENVKPVIQPVAQPAIQPRQSMQMGQPMASRQKSYAEMIEQALAEPLPVETAASAVGLIKDVPASSAVVQPVVPSNAPEVKTEVPPVVPAMGQPVNQPGVVLPPPPAPVAPVQNQVQTVQPVAGQAQPTVSLVVAQNPAQGVQPATNPAQPSAAAGMPAPDAFRIPGM